MPTSPINPKYIPTRSQFASAALITMIGGSLIGIGYAMGRKNAKSQRQTQIRDAMLVYGGKSKRKK